MTKHETINESDLVNYILFLRDEGKEYFNVSNRLAHGEASKEEVQAFMEWRDSKYWELEKYNRANKVNL